MGNTYGYIRVSTREQNEDRQLLRQCGICSDRTAAAWGEVTRLFACLGCFAGEKPRKRFFGGK